MTLGPHTNSFASSSIKDQRIDLHFLGKASIIGIIHDEVVLCHRSDQQGSDNAEKDGISD